MKYRRRVLNGNYYNGSKDTVSTERVNRMKTIQEFLENQISEDLILAVLSGSRKKDIPTRVRIRPVELKGRILYQASSTVGQKVLHSNYTREELLSYMEQCLSGDYSQLQVQGRC